MADTHTTGNRTHPMIIVAATAVILTCLIAVGVMTGIVPTKRSASTPDVATAPAPNTPAQSSALMPNTQSSNQTAKEPARTAAKSRTTAERADVGSTSSTAGTGAAGGGTSTAAAKPAAAPCPNCGTVVAVRTVKEQVDASPLGPAAGALIGGVIGNQIGSGSGRTIATVVGAGAGAAAGTEIERRARATTRYVIDVRMEDGTVRHFDSPSAPPVQVGSKVKVIDGKLHLA